MMTGIPIDDVNVARHQLMAEGRLHACAHALDPDLINMSNPVVRSQIISPQPRITPDFYRKAFGWQCDTQNALGAREVETGGDVVRHL